jgi:hypothetical protein
VAAQAVEISGDDNLVPLVTTEVDGSQLRVGTNKRVAPKLELLVRATTPTLDAVSLSGSNTVKLRDVASETFAIDTSGSSRLVATGKTKKLTINVAGSATIDTLGLAAEDVTIAVSGSGDVDVSATGVLEVQISGSGRVRYAGPPRDIKKQITGSGSVEPK